MLGSPNHIKKLGWDGGYYNDHPIAHELKQLLDTYGRCFFTRNTCDEATPPMSTKYWVPENSSVTLGVSDTNTDTTGKTIGAYAVDEDDVATELGTTSGAAAGTDISIIANCALIEPGMYRLEIVADKDGANPITLIPNVNTSSRVYLVVEPIAAIA